MADNRTMAQMLQAPIEGYEDAIVVPPINANNFELKQPLINLVQSNKFTDKEPPRSILTWDDLVSKFINQFFPPSKTTYLRNEITTFYQKPNETFNEAWERFKGLLRQCPHHGFSELHQLDTFYNSLNTNDQDALDSAAGENFLDKMPHDGLAIIESKSKVRYSRSRLNDSRAIKNAPSSTSSPSNNSFEIQQMAALFEDKMNIRMSRLEKAISEKNVTTPTTVKAVEEEPEQNLETSTEKVQNPNLENTAHVPPPKEEDSIFIEILKPKAKKTVNVEIQDLNSPRPNSYQSKLPYPERMKVRENDKPSAQHSRFLKMFKQLRLEIGLKDALVEKLEDPRKFLIQCALQELNRTSALADSRASINLLPHSIYKQLGLEALTPTQMTLELANRSISHPMGIAEDVVVRVDGFTFLADFIVVNFEPDPRVPINLGRTFLTINPLFDEMEEDVEIKNSNVSDEAVLLNTPLSDKVDCFTPEDNIDEIDAFLAIEVSSKFEEGYFDSEGDFFSDSPLHSSRNDRELGNILVLDSALRDFQLHGSQENFIKLNDIIPPGVENDDSKNKDNELPNLDNQDDPSIPRPPPEPPDIEKCFKPESGLTQQFLKTLVSGVVRIYQKSQENRQKRASTDTRTEECTKAGSKAMKKSTLSQTVKGKSNHGQQNSLSSSSHEAMEKAHKDVGFTLHLLSKEAQVSLKRIATLAIRVRSLSDPTAQNVDPMIG
ncbi:reverse transcriptase domain-containing protein [Tanacetum coccineum]